MAVEYFERELIASSDEYPEFPHYSSEKMFNISENPILLKK
jgi:hypothetical protein